MKKRILCTLLSAAMLFTSSPVVFAAETQPVKEQQQTKETLPFTIKEANNDIKDESVKGWHVQITDTENAKVVADYPGLVVVRAKKTQYDDNVYLIGKSGIVQTFVVSGTDTDWDENVAMKCAFGENPKRCYRDKCDSTRMSTAAFLRGALNQARDYGARKQAANGDVTKMPAYNQKLEALLPVLDGTIPLKAHAHQANDIFTALRIAREFGLRLTLEHVTEGHLIVDELAKEANVPMAVGPSLTFASKFELQNKSWATPGVLAKAGCHVSIITDNSVIPQQYLPLCAGMAVKAGMDPFDALRAITLNAAEHIGVADRVGSLEVGKDPDVVIPDGSPFAVMTEVRAVFIDGEMIRA